MVPLRVLEGLRQFGGALVEELGSCRDACWIGFDASLECLTCKFNLMVEREGGGWDAGRVWWSREAIVVCGNAGGWRGAANCFLEGISDGRNHVCESCGSKTFHFLLCEMLGVLVGERRLKC
jgi:hypothetical protein